MSIIVWDKRKCVCKDSCIYWCFFMFKFKREIKDVNRSESGHVARTSDPLLAGTHNSRTAWKRRSNAPIRLGFCTGCRLKLRTKHIVNRTVSSSYIPTWCSGIYGLFMQLPELLVNIKVLLRLSVNVKADRTEWKGSGTAHSDVFISYLSMDCINLYSLEAV